VPALVAAGIKRVNVSCDSLDPAVYRRVTRGGDLGTVLAGITAAQDAGLEIKLNVVALRQDNRGEIPEIIAYAHAHGMEVSLIETMPLGEDIAREDQFVSLADVVAELQSFWTLAPAGVRTGGPARYYNIAETGGRLGLITPLSHNFCDTCNRVRVTCTGRMYMCLGQDDHVDFRPALRAGDGAAGDGALGDILAEALRHKPKAHDFAIDARTGHRPPRTMSLTGG
jgi:cyclic pyranopterin phosphate synthase